MANNKARSSTFAEGRTPNLRELELAEIEKATVLAKDSPQEMWPTPHANCHTGPGRQGRQGGANLQPAVAEEPERLWPTPTASLANGAAATWKEGEIWWRQSRAARNLEAMAIEPQRLWPTPNAQESGISSERLVDRDGNPPTHWNQRLYDRETGRLAQDGLLQAVEIAERNLWPTPTLKTTSNTDDPDDLVNKEGEPWRLGEKPYDRRTGRPVTTALADAVRAEPGEMWPTPRMEGFDAGGHRGKPDSLPRAVKARTPVDPATKPKLCAAWVTRLMGYPDGWLDRD